jgi:uncharacterized membrane protein YeiB
MASGTLTRPDQARRLLLWALLCLVPLVILIVSLFMMTARHNAQLSAQAEAHNAQLMEMTALHNHQLMKMTEEYNAQLAAQAAEFQKRR